MTSTYDALVVGAGPAGLATSAALSRAGVQHLVLERGEQIGQTWANLYDSLVLHTAKRLSALPGLPLPASTPLFPPRQDFLAHLIATRPRFACRLRPAPGHEPRSADGIRRPARLRGWSGADRRRRHGIVSNPAVPPIPGQTGFGERVLTAPIPPAGRLHRPARAELAAPAPAGDFSGSRSRRRDRDGRRSNRRPRHPARDRGIPIQSRRPARRAATARAAVTMALMGRVSTLVRGPAVSPPSSAGARTCSSSASTWPTRCARGHSLQEGGVTAFTSGGVRFTDDTEPFDAVISRPASRGGGMLGNAIRADDCGFARRRDGVVARPIRPVRRRAQLRYSRRAVEHRARCRAGGRAGRAAACYIPNTH